MPLSTINLFQFHSTWFQIENKFILYIHDFVVIQMMVSFPFKKGNKLYKKTKGWNNGKSFVSNNVIIGEIIFLSLVLPSPPPPPPPPQIWMERDTGKERDCAIIFRRGGGGEKWVSQGEILHNTPPLNRGKLALTLIQISQKLWRPAPPSTTYKYSKYTWIFYLLFVER